MMTNGQMLNLYNRLLSSGYGPILPLHFVLKGDGCDFSTHRYFSLPQELLRCATSTKINETMHIECQTYVGVSFVCLGTSETIKARSAPKDFFSSDAAACIETAKEKQMTLEGYANGFGNVRRLLERD